MAGKRGKVRHRSGSGGGSAAGGGRKGGSKGKAPGHGLGRATRDERPARGYEFRDRSGKVHQFGPGAGGGGGASAKEREPRREKPHGRRAEEPRQERTHGQREERQERHPRGHGQGHGAGKRREERHPRGGRPGEREHRKGGRPPRHKAPGRHMGAGTFKATIDKNQRGFGFLVFDERGVDDIFIPPRTADQLFHGDRVEVTLDARGQVEEVAILEHRFRELVGRYSPMPGGKGKGWVVYERKRAREEVFVTEIQGRVAPNDWVRAKLHFHEEGPYPVTAEIVEVYGAELPASADIGMVSAEYNLAEAHSEAAEREAREKKLEVPGRDLEGRTDLRHVPFITIDGETARDFDDAVYVERHKNGHVLWVAIADVSHYVTHNSALDKEARSRGTSVYFPEKAFHMLPRALSENLCSLRPNEPRLSMAARMEYDLTGKRLSTEVMDAVIESRRRATYNQIQAEWEENKRNPGWEYAPHFELYQIIRKTRAERGSIDFDLPEAEMKVEPNGEVISITNRSRLDAHRLIEEFMIAANEAVTEWIMERGWPFVFRVHEEPAEQSLEKFQNLAATVGVRVSIDNASPRTLAEVVRRLEGHPAQTMLNMALLRSMKQAVYSSTHGIHYGLASEAYTHFTSPIRRYPDLVVHRLLRRALHVEQKRGRALGGKEREALEAELADVCEHCSYRERLASDAERESIKLKQVRLMTRHLGEEFDGKIVGMVESGMFVQLLDPYVEGMVSQESMMDDFYQFNEERMVFVGKRKKKSYKIGDPVRIRVLRADIDSRKIDFGLVSDAGSG